MKAKLQIYLAVIALIGIFAGLQANAASDGADAPDLGELKVKCSGTASYINLNFTVVLDFASDSLLGSYETEGGESWEYSWSESECEDSTALSIEKKDLQDFLTGETAEFWARFTQEEPDIELKAYVRCTKN